MNISDSSNLRHGPVIFLLKLQLGAWIAALFVFGSHHLGYAAATAAALAYLCAPSPVSHRWARVYLVVVAQWVAAALWYVVRTAMRAPAGWEQAAACACALLGAVLILVMAASLVDLVSFLGRRRFPARDKVLGHPPPETWPGVCFQLPAYDEPPEMVIATISQLLKQDYPGRWMIQVIDNNTPDPATWHPLRDFCAKAGARIEFMHLDNWPGFKAGALNEGIRRMPKWVEHVAIVDADYLVETSFLRLATVQFDDSRVAFVQTPQNYRGWEQSALLRSLYYNYEEYYQTRKPSRGEVNGIICVGTMAVIRKAAIEQVGLWDEASCTEDAEVSLRLLSRGWRGVFDQRVNGQGIMPLDFSGLCKQRFRWALGMMHIFRKHKDVLLTARSGERRLTWMQRLSFWGLANQYLTELVPVVTLGLFFSGTILHCLDAGEAVVEACFDLPALAMALYVSTAFARMVVATKSCNSSSAAAGAAVVSFSLCWVTARACLCGFASRKVVFLRTPKEQAGGSWFSALGSARIEACFTTLAAMLALCLFHQAFFWPAAAAVLLALVFGSSPAIALAYLSHGAGRRHGDLDAGPDGAVEEAMPGELTSHVFTELTSTGLADSVGKKLDAI